MDYNGTSSMVNQTNFAALTVELRAVDLCYVLFQKLILYDTFTT
jgi:hypothetical protein